MNKPKTCLDNLHICKASCCKVLPFDKLGYFPEALKDYYIKHGCKVIRLKRDLHRILVPMRCPQLDDNNLCKLHDTAEKPHYCSLLNKDTANDECVHLTEGCIYAKN